MFHPSEISMAVSVFLIHRSACSDNVKYNLILTRPISSVYQIHFIVTIKSVIHVLLFRNKIIGGGGVAQAPIDDNIPYTIFKDRIICPGSVESHPVVFGICLAIISLNMTVMSITRKRDTFRKTNSPNLMVAICCDMISSFKREINTKGARYMVSIQGRWRPRTPMITVIYTACVCV